MSRSCSGVITKAQRDRETKLPLSVLDRPARGETEREREREISLGN